MHPVITFHGTRFIGAASVSTRTHVHVSLARVEFPLDTGHATQVTFTAGIDNVPPVLLNYSYVSNADTEIQLPNIFIIRKTIG